MPAPDLSISIGKLRFPYPVIIASGPITRKATLVRKAEENEAGGVSLKLSFVKPPFDGEMRGYSVEDFVIMNPIERRLSLEEAVELIQESKRLTRFPIFINYGGTAAVEGWKRQTEAYEKAGADALELNLCCPNLDTSYTDKRAAKRHGGAQLGQDPEAAYRVVRAVREVSGLPLVPKFLPNAYQVEEVIAAVEEAGADAIHLVSTPISGLAPLDVYNGGGPTIPLLKETTAFGSTNGTLCKYAAFRMTAEYAGSCRTPLIVSGGIDTWKDAVTHILLGAHSVSICCAPMWHGWDVVKRMNAGIRNYMEQMGYGSFADFRGLARDRIVTPDKLQLIEGHVAIDRERCLGCGRCTKPAHCDALHLQGQQVVIETENCIGCGVCQSLCPVDAISYVERR